MNITFLFCAYPSHNIHTTLCIAVTLSVVSEKTGAMLPTADEIEAYIRANWHYLLFGLAVASFVASRAKQAAVAAVADRNDKSARAAVRAEARAREQTAEERIIAARERQFAIAQLAAEKDREKHAEAERLRLEEQREKLEKRNTGEESSGHRLGHGDQQSPPHPPPAPSQNSKPKNEPAAGDETKEGPGQDGPRLKLPKLPGGDRQQYTPYTGPGDDRGYRPSRYQRNCGPKGG